MAREKESLVEMTIPAKPEFLRVVRLMVSGYASRLNIPVDAVENLKVAVSEACNNSIQAAEEKEVDDSIKIRCWCDNGSIFFEVSDKFQGGPDFRAPMAEDFSEQGLGFVLIQTLMDHVDLKSSKSGGTKVLMRKEL